MGPIVANQVRQKTPQTVDGRRILVASERARRPELAAVVRVGRQTDSADLFSPAAFLVRLHCETLKHGYSACGHQRPAQPLGWSDDAIGNDVGGQEWFSQRRPHRTGFYTLREETSALLGQHQRIHPMELYAEGEYDQTQRQRLVAGEFHAQFSAQKAMSHRDPRSGTTMARAFISKIDRAR